MKISRAFQMLGNGKATGPDGKSKTVYQKFWDKSGIRTSESTHEGVTAIGLLSGAIQVSYMYSHIETKKKSYKSAKNHRPISLLNHISKALEKISPVVYSTQPLKDYTSPHRMLPNSR